VTEYCILESKLLGMSLACCRQRPHASHNLSGQKSETAREDGSYFVTSRTSLWQLTQLNVSCT
jgi:hypothetical protein